MNTLKWSWADDALFLLVDADDDGVDETVLDVSSSSIEDESSLE